MRKTFLIVFGLCAVISLGGTAAAGTIDFNFEKSTPVGSWQEREQTMTDEDGKQIVTVMRISYLGEEERDGELYVWTEMEMNSFKTIKVESTSTQWISSEVPFGIVKIVSDDMVNGDPQHSETVLTGFGLSGAISKITGEPQDMPSIGNLFGG